MDFINKIVLISKPPLDRKGEPVVLKREEIKSEFIWKKLTWSNKVKEIIHCEICYSSAESGYAQPQIEISPKDNKSDYFCARLIKSAWIQDGKYTVSFLISRDSLKEAVLSIESQAPNHYVETKVLDIPDKNP